MAGLFNWFRQGSTHEARHQISDEQKSNPYRELVLLNGHTDEVYNLSSQDDGKIIVSLSQDCTAIMWSAESGQKLCTLVGHKSPINSTVYQGRGEENTFVTGASDGIKFWRLPVDMRPDHGTLTPSEEASEHIQCLTANESLGYIVSGGSTLCLWSKEGHLIDKWQTKKSLNVTKMIVVKAFDWNIVALTDYSDSRRLDVWEVKELVSKEKSGEVKTKISLSFSKSVNTEHKDDICYLQHISEKCFATGCQKRQVFVWSSISISKLKAIETTFKSSVNLKGQGDLKTGEAKMTCVCPLLETFVVIGIETTFEVYNTDPKRGKYDDVMMANQVAQVCNAHDYSITHAFLVHNNDYLVTCSRDRIRLWQAPGIDGKKHLSVLHALSSNASGSPPAKRGRKDSKLGLQLIGDLEWHKEIKCSCSAGNINFVSCGSECDVVMWLDYNIEVAKREKKLIELLKDKIL